MHAYVKNKVIENQISTSHFNGRPKFPPKNKREPGEVMTFDPLRWKRQDPDRLRMAMTESGVPYVCKKCGNGPEWDGRPLTLQIDHIDGNWRDSRIENLRFLCPNCHSQTPTHSISRSKNGSKGKGAINVEMTCNGCNNKFFTKPRRINEARRKGKEMYCSPRCVSDNYRRVTREEAISVFNECGSAAEAGRRLGVSSITIRRKLGG